MAIGGPRLDDPSAIGDEGRARTASLWIATVVVVAVVGVVGVRAGETSLLPALGTLVGTAVAGVALLERDSFAQLFVAHLLLVTFGSVLALLVLVGPFVDRGLFVVAACAVALLGIAAGWADVGSDDVALAVRSAMTTYLAMIVTAAVASIVLVGAIAGRSALEALTAATAPLWSLVAVLIVLCVTAVAALFGLRALPVVQLTPRSRRERVERRLESVRRGLRWTAFGAPVLIGVAVVLRSIGGVGGGLVTLPILRVLSSPFVVWPLVAVGFGTLLVGLFAGAMRRLTRQISVESTRKSVGVLVGVVVTVVGVAAGVLIVLGIFRGDPRFVFGLSISTGSIAALLLVGPLAILVVGGIGVLTAKLGLLPARATGPAIAATGLLFVAIGLGGGEPALTFATVAAALLVWDVSTFGLGLTAELGHLPETRRLELFHGAVAVGVAIGAVLLAIGLEVLRTGAFAGISGVSGAVVIAFGALLLLVPLRG